MSNANTTHVCDIITVSGSEYEIVGDADGNLYGRRYATRHPQALDLNVDYGFEPLYDNPAVGSAMLFKTGVHTTLVADLV